MQFQGPIHALHQMTISIAVSARRAFMLPADLATAKAHFRDFRRMLRCLPELRLVKTHAQGQYRIRYGAAEGGVYRVDLYSDINAQFDDAAGVLEVTPLQGIPAVASRATPGSLTGQGDYSSRLTLRAAGRGTEAAYEVRISAALAKPVGLKLIPDAAVGRFVEMVVRRRIEDITDAFIARAVEGLRPQRRGSA